MRDTAIRYASTVPWWRRVLEALATAMTNWRARRLERTADEDLMEAIETRWR